MTNANNTRITEIRLPDKVYTEEELQEAISRTKEECALILDNSKAYNFTLSQLAGQIRNKK